jgi:exodeoxyribonuclease X
VIIRCFDFETTGIPEGEDKHAIVEIGRCDVEQRDDGFLFCDAPGAVLCNPGRPIPPAASAVHHIVDKHVASADGHVGFIGDDADYYAAHNADFEKQFWQPPKPLICTWKVALRIWPEEMHHGLQYLRYFLGLHALSIFADPPHRAGPDAYVCGLLVEHILKHKLCTVAEMVRWSSGPGLLTIVNFGKHKGERWEKLPDGYLNWMVDAPDMDPVRRANARFQLKRRNLVNAG